jgi:hypothetical protein
VPYGAGDGELRIVASQDIGQLGPRDGRPVVFRWRWYYHVPALPLWAIVLLLLIVPKANRRLEAWLILAPLGVVLLVWRMPAVLFSMSDGSTETLGFFVVSGTLAWSMIWLLGHWVGFRYRIVTTVLLWAIMFAVGLLSYYCHYADGDDPATYLIIYGLCAAFMLLAMMFTSLFCRWTFSWTKFLVLLLALNIAVVMVAMMAYGALMLILEPGIGGWAEFPMIATIVTLFVGTCLYLVNLPFLVLASKSPLYWDRFQRLFRVQRDQYWNEMAEGYRRMRENRGEIGVETDRCWDEMSAGPLDDSPTSTEPTSQRVTADDLVGRWQFYLDAAAVTVSLDFRLDGAFCQTLVFNQGSIRECPAGTWRLDGPWVHLYGYTTAGDGLRQSCVWCMIDTPSGLALFGGDGPNAQSSFRMRRHGQSLPPTNTWD